MSSAQAFKTALIVFIMFIFAFLGPPRGKGSTPPSPILYTPPFILLDPSTRLYIPNHSSLDPRFAQLNSPALFILPAGCSSAADEEGLLSTSPSTSVMTTPVLLVIGILIILAVGVVVKVKGIGRGRGLPLRGQRGGETTPSWNAPSLLSNPSPRTLQGDVGKQGALTPDGHSPDYYSKKIKEILNNVVTWILHRIAVFMNTCRYGALVFTTKESLAPIAFRVLGVLQARVSVSPLAVASLSLVPLCIVWLRTAVGIPVAGCVLSAVVVWSRGRSVRVVAEKDSVVEGAAVLEEVVEESPVAGRSVGRWWAVSRAEEQVDEIIIIMHKDGTHGENAFDDAVTIDQGHPCHALAVSSAEIGACNLVTGNTATTDLLEALREIEREIEAGVKGYKAEQWVIGESDQPCGTSKTFVDHFRPSAFFAAVTRQAQMTAFCKISTLDAKMEDVSMADSRESGERLGIYTAYEPNLTTTELEEEIVEVHRDEFEERERHMTEEEKEEARARHPQYLDYLRHREMQQFLYGVLQELANTHGTLFNVEMASSELYTFKAPNVAGCVLVGQAFEEQSILFLGMCDPDGHAVRYMEKQEYQKQAAYFDPPEDAHGARQPYFDSDYDFNFNPFAEDDRADVRMDESEGRSFDKEDPRTWRTFSSKLFEDEDEEEPHYGFDSAAQQDRERQRYRYSEEIETPKFFEGGMDWSDFSTIVREAEKLAGANAELGEGGDWDGTSPMSVPSSPPSFASHSHPSDNATFRAFDGPAPPIDNLGTISPQDPTANVDVFDLTAANIDMFDSSSSLNAGPLRDFTNAARTTTDSTSERRKRRSRSDHPRPCKTDENQDPFLATQPRTPSPHSFSPYPRRGSHSPGRRRRWARRKDGVSNFSHV